MQSISGDLETYLATGLFNRLSLPFQEVAVSYTAASSITMSTPHPVLKVASPCLAYLRERGAELSQLHHHDRASGRHRRFAAVCNHARTQRVPHHWP